MGMGCVCGRAEESWGRTTAEQTPGCKKEVRRQQKEKMCCIRRTQREEEKGVLKGIKAEMYFKKQTGGEKTGPR